MRVKRGGLCQAQSRRLCQPEFRLWVAGSLPPWGHPGFREQSPFWLWQPLRSLYHNCWALDSKYPIRPSFFLAASPPASQVWVGGKGEWLGFDVSDAEAGRWGCGLPACFGGSGPAPTLKPQNLAGPGCLGLSGGRWFGTSRYSYHP